uniref:DnaJ homolog subfamily C member 16 n=1 Tax=Timema shepardi TaxID=629360 RepID=A0A7R9AWT4_TIMSH|nr:unnamed protein product [Timema shepardi]
MIIKLWKYFTILSLVSLTMGEDYYSLLGVRRDANKKEIRQTYKKLAVTLHPDKNQDDPDAHEKFLSITKAYETLKDDELRKKYDLYGEEGAPKHQSYHSWSFYQENFGIYDDDPEVITLDTLDFEQSVLNTDTLWFINFYSPICSHCHEMAPEWRKMARELEGVVRIGAVNCVDEWNLCNMEHIASYPTLKIYPSDMRTQLLLGSSTPWLILFYVGSTVKEDLELKKLSVLLFNMHVGKVNCAKLLSICLDLNVNRYPLFAVFKQGGGYEIHHGKESAHDVANFAKESGAAINVRILTPKEYYLARNQVTKHIGIITKKNIYSSFCMMLSIVSLIRYDTQAASSTNQPNQANTSLIRLIYHFVVIRLTEHDFSSMISEKPSNELWLLNYFAPWCYSCKALTPEWRHLAKVIHFSF